MQQENVGQIKGFKAMYYYGGLTYKYSYVPMNLNQDGLHDKLLALGGDSLNGK